MPLLRVGCTVIIKPSPFRPLSTLRLVKLFNSVLSPGVIKVVTGDASGRPSHRLPSGHRQDPIHGIHRDRKDLDVRLACPAPPAPDFRRL
jgi:hypothetical protein